MDSKKEDEIMENLIEIKTYAELLENQDVENPVSFSEGVLNHVGERISSCVSKIINIAF